MTVGTPLRLGTPTQVRRREIREALKDGSLSLSDAVRDPAVKNATLYTVASWQHRWGHQRVAWLLAHIGGDEFVTCKELTAHDVSMLARLADGR